MIEAQKVSDNFLAQIVVDLAKEQNERIELARKWLEKISK